MTTSSIIDQPLLRLEHIRRLYPNGDTVVRALDDISLTIWPGEFVAIIGQSGSGKSTLMNLIGCLDKPTAGLAGDFSNTHNNAGDAQKNSGRLSVAYEVDLWGANRARRDAGVARLVGEVFARDALKLVVSEPQPIAR